MKNFQLLKDNYMEHDSNFREKVDLNYFPSTDEKYKSSMIRISIKWTDRMLLAGAAACNIKIEQLNPLTGYRVETLFKARGKIEKYSIGYSDCEWGPGMTGNLFDTHIKPYLNCMMQSYRRGMTLENEDYHWIQDLRELNKGA
jgi:hypothetical protein